MPQSEDKLAIFERIAKEYNDPKKVMVVGDRRDREIRYGNMMGFTTVLVPGFKYKDIYLKYKNNLYYQLINFMIPLLFWVKR